MFFETSAKTALNVEEAFLTTASIIAKNIEKGEYDLSNEVNKLDLMQQSIGIKPGNALPSHIQNKVNENQKKKVGRQNNDQAQAQKNSSSCC